MKTLYITLPTVLLLLFFSFQNTFAQHQLHGRITDAKGVALPGASVALTTPDTTAQLVKGAVSDAEGNYALIDLPAGKYRLAVNLLSFEGYASEPFILKDEASERDLGTVVLAESATTLSEATATAKRPVFEQHIDRLVVNVANSITSAGATALEVLERSPGVVVNRQSNAISMLGKSGVVIMINGKVSRIPPETVIQMLSGMSSANIERIELIHTPPSNFDAEGNAGFINIVLRKNTDYGLNGNLALSAGYGRGEVGSADLNFNLRQQKTSLYGSYGYTRDGREQRIEEFRHTESAGVTTDLHTLSRRYPTDERHTARLGLDYDLSKKTVIGVLASGFDSRWVMDADNSAEIGVSNAPDTVLDIFNHEYHRYRHFAGNANVQHTFRPDESLNFDLDYLYFGDDNPNDYTNRYLDEQGQLLYKEQARSTKNTPLHIYVSQLDYKKKWNPWLNMESGVKAARSRFTNDVHVANFRQANWETDPTLTGKYHLEEDIAAAYTSFEIKMGAKTSAKAGLRYEHTRAHVQSATQSDLVDRDYGNFFPTLYLSRQLNATHALNFSYSRRITRPTFQDLAPFVIFLDPSTFFSGNVALQPAIAHAFKVDFTHKSALFSVAYTHEDSTIANFQSRVDVATNRETIASENLKNTKTLSALFSVPLHFAPWWEARISLTGIWQQANAYVEGSPLRVNNENANCFAVTNVNFGKGYGLEVSGFYQSPSLFGTALTKSFWGMNAGLQKQFKGEHGSLRLTVDDLFDTFFFRWEYAPQGQPFALHGNFDLSQPTVKLTYARNFGSQKVKSARARAVAEEERRRAKAN